MPQRLAAPDVPDARHDALVEQRLADRPPLVDLAEVRDDRVAVELGREDVRPERRDTARRRLEHRSPAQHGLRALARQHEPRHAAHRCAGRHRPPAPGHAEMAAQHAASLEAKQEVLAVSLHGFEASPVESLGDSGRTSPRMHGLDGQPLTRREREAAPPRDGRCRLRAPVRGGARPAAARRRSPPRGGSA